MTLNHFLVRSRVTLLCISGFNGLEPRKIRIKTHDAFLLRCL